MEPDHRGRLPVRPRPPCSGTGCWCIKEGKTQQVGEGGEGPTQQVGEGGEGPTQQVEREGRGRHSRWGERGGEGPTQQVGGGEGTDPNSNLPCDPRVVLRCET